LEANNDKLEKGREALGHNAFDTAYFQHQEETTYRILSVDISIDKGSSANP
jgi:cell division protein FtsB